MTDRAYIVRVRPAPIGVGFAATVQDMTRDGLTPSQGSGTDPFEAISVAFHAMLERQGHYGR